MIRLTPYEREMLDGRYGRARQIALQKIVQYADVLGADELCAVDMAHLFCGAHGYYDAYRPDDPDDLEALLSEMALSAGETVSFPPVACFCQTDCGPMDPLRWAEMGIPPERAAKNRRILDYFLARGVHLVGSCVPYMLGFIPTRGQHYVSSESHAVVLMNALWGASGNADGLEAGFWSALCGRTPKWGNHLPGRREGTHPIEQTSSQETHLEPAAAAPKLFQLMRSTLRAKSFCAKRRGATKR